MSNLIPMIRQSFLDLLCSAYQQDNWDLGLAHGSNDQLTRVTLDYHSYQHESLRGDCRIYQ